MAVVVVLMIVVDDAVFVDDCLHVAGPLTMICSYLLMRLDPQ